MYCADQHWFGIENLALIPGLTGAAPVQNIGAYGVELADVLEAVQIVDAQDRLRWLGRDAVTLAIVGAAFRSEQKK